MTRRLALCLPCLALLAQAPAAQEVEDPQARRVRARIQALEQEAVRLASQAGTLLGELRTLEIERDLRAEELRQATAAATETAHALSAAAATLASAELERVGELPSLEAELVDLYKRGPMGHARLLLGASDMRTFARAARAVAALAARSEKRLAAHRESLTRLRAERAQFEEAAGALDERQADARRARVTADRAVERVNALIDDIDSRRDLTAQYLGELRQVAERLDAELRAIGRSGAAPPVPIRPFRGGLDWPVSGRVMGGFNERADRLGGSPARNGVEIGATLDAPVRAVHGGTVGFAGPFPGFGTLVILDHGAGVFSLYGYLGAAAVQQGARVDAGAEVGSVGSAPAGPAALYFEMRVDDTPVDPVEWLKPL